MPFLSLKRPALGVALLKSTLGRAGIACDVRYPCFDFADLVGLSTYQRVAQSLPTHHLVGDWIFAPALWGAPLDGDFHAEVLTRDPTFYDSELLADVETSRIIATTFIATCADAFDARRYDIVGFTSTFQQNVASFALAKELKRRHPHLATMFGGANFEGEMGVEYHRQLPFVDVVCSGEGDLVVPELVRRIRSSSSLEGLPGITYRHDGETVPGAGSAELVRDLDDLPYPDHSDFMERFATSEAATLIKPELTLETSRGCWWGAKHHCTFCGLNGLGMTFRSKSADRAFAEIAHLIDSYDVLDLFNTDNILDMRYFGDLFPKLRDAGIRLGLHYETKANLKKWQLVALRELGTDWFQPGVESLSSHVLSLIDKGVKGIQNVQLLKWARELDFRVSWNILCGFPGETAQDYVAMADVMRLIPHLAPPASFAPFRLDRFSPAHTRASASAAPLRPYPAYRHLYDFDAESLVRVAYFFENDIGIPEDVVEAINVAWVVSEAWKRHHHVSTLTAVVSDSFVLVDDERHGHPPATHLLVGAERAILLHTDAVCSTAALHRDLDERWGTAAVDAGLAGLVARRLVLSEGDAHLALPTLAAMAPPQADHGERAVVAASGR